MVKRLLVVAVLALILAGPAGADMIAPAVGSPDMAIDFRTTAWKPAYDRPSYQVDNVIATALPSGNVLYQDGRDGLGIRHGGQDDEIDWEEQLKIEIEGGMYLGGLWLTDIFTANDGNADGEEGSVLLTMTDFSTVTLSFNGYWPLGTNNGELFVPFGQAYYVKEMLFSSVKEANDEYSVAGAVAPVPVPGAMLLGILGLATASAKLRKKQTE